MVFKTTDMAPILSVRNLSTGYGKKQVLFDVSLDVMPGEILLITGGNGSCKSTLLKSICGLLPLQNADVQIACASTPFLSRDFARLPCRIRAK